MSVLQRFVFALGIEVACRVCFEAFLAYEIRDNLTLNSINLIHTFPLCCRRAKTGISPLARLDPPPEANR